MISLVIPVYDEEGNVESLHRKLTRAAEGVGGSYEIVFVNDGSRDGTLARLEALRAADPHVRIVDLDGNFGEAAARASRTPGATSSSRSTATPRTIPRTSRAWSPRSARSRSRSRSRWPRAGSWSTPRPRPVASSSSTRPSSTTRWWRRCGGWSRPGRSGASCICPSEGGVTAHVYVSWLPPEKTAKVTVVGEERMLSYEGRFEKRGITLYEYALDRRAPAGEGAPIVPVSRFAARPLEIPAGREPLAIAAEHFVASVLAGTEPLTSGARSLRVVEVLEGAERGATRGGRAA